MEVVFFVIWTARISVALFLASVYLQVAGRKPVHRRVLWNAGFAVFLIHMLAAFHFIHVWSHTAAWKHTAEQTEQLTGWYWGGGLWFNYLFAIVWGYDVLRPTLSEKHRAPWIGRWIRIFMGLVVFNATVVFGAWWWKVVAWFYIPPIGYFLWIRSRKAHTK